MNRNGDVEVDGVRRGACGRGFSGVRGACVDCLVHDHDDLAPQLAAELSQCFVCLTAEAAQLGCAVPFSSTADLHLAGSTGKNHIASRSRRQCQDRKDLQYKKKKE